MTTSPQANVGTGQCVALVEAYTNVRRPAATYWQPDGAVRGNAALQRGTAIATFVNGRYPSHPHGNHAALYISQDAKGIWVVDQYIGHGGTASGITKRYLRFKGALPSGTYIDPSNNGDAFSVIK